MKKQKALGCLSRTKYDTMISMLKKEFEVPVSQRTQEQKQAIMQLRKLRDQYGLNDSGQLLCHGKIVNVEDELSAFVKKAFKDSHGCAPRVLYNKMKLKYTGFTLRKVIEILSKSKSYHRQYPRFTNKPIPKTVTADRPGHRWQIDLIDMSEDAVMFNGHTYKYILQIIDVYSRYILPQPLKSKKSTEIAAVLEKTIMQNGAPKIIQCDNGPEFKGQKMDQMMEKHGVEVIHGRPYYPQSQGKKESVNDQIAF
ncbi:SCAN domain-containing protein 3-like [Mercenaria mercenaria]|uniref:SCAN domain-containing protein 3-like n=1 Tax=Mercenaria mercenaria TaxID=6596 RepID=UPI00234F07A8|nr:SCAN domain-containing protein 3-like [Mercenaria mercenaria]